MVDGWGRVLGRGSSVESEESAGRRMEYVLLCYYGDMSKRKLSEMLRNADLIYREPVTLRSGEVSDYYADIKKAYGDPKILAEIAQETLEAIDEKTTCLAASGYGGVPLGVAVSQLSGLPLSLVRDTQKNHGKKGMIDGYKPTPKDKVSLLDDVFTTGGSLMETAVTLQTTGAQVISCHVIVSRGDVQAFDFPVTYLFKPQDLIKP